MDFLSLVTEMVELRSFSNLWYWIALATVWSSVSHWVLGVPYDLISRARRGDAQSAHDMRVLAEVNCNRILSVMDISGPWVVGFAACLVTGLVVLGWGYDVEFCQAVFFLLAPMVVVVALSLHSARRLVASDYEDLSQVLRWHRLKVQILGMIAIFLTAFWGMWVNLNHSALGV